MVATTDYKDRFAAAMRHAGVGEAEVRAALGITYQALKKVLEGRTKQMAADNNSRAAKFMRVSTDWLATGEGQMSIALPANASQQAPTLSAALYAVVYALRDLPPSQRDDIIGLIGPAVRLQGDAMIAEIAQQIEAAASQAQRARLLARVTQENLDRLAQHIQASTDAAIPEATPEPRADMRTPT